MVTRIETESETMIEPKPPRIDLNRADEAALRSLPGIGPGLASRIIAYRDEHGPFLFEEDITQVDGVSASLYEELADRLTVTIPTADDVAATEATAPVVAESLPSSGEIVIDEPAVHHALAVEPTPPVPNPKEVAADDDAGWELDVEEELAESEAPPVEHAAIPVPGPVAGEVKQPAQSERAPGQRGRFAWFWTALLGAVLGGLLGLGLSMLVFAGINGSVDVNRSVAIRQVKGQINELSVELDAVQGDVGILQGNVSGLRERVEVLSGLTARMEQAEETLATFTKEIQALANETKALTSSLADLSQDVDTMGETLDAVEAQTEKATTFFERLQQLLQEIFAEQLAEPQSAAPQRAAPDLEVDA